MALKQECISRKIAKINFKEKKSDIRKVLKVLIIRLLCLLNNLDFVGQSAAIDSFSTRKLHSKLKSARLRGAVLRMFGLT